MPFSRINNTSSTPVDFCRQSCKNAPAVLPKRHTLTASAPAPQIARFLALSRSRFFSFPSLMLEPLLLSAAWFRLGEPHAGQAAAAAHRRWKVGWGIPSSHVAVGQQRYPKWNPGKWKHGLKPAVP